MKLLSRNLRARLKVKADEERYFCQSTELLRSTEAFPGRMKPWLVRIAFRQIRQKDRSAVGNRQSSSFAGFG